MEVCFTCSAPPSSAPRPPPSDLSTRLRAAASVFHCVPADLCLLSRQKLPENGGKAPNAGIGRAALQLRTFLTFMVASRRTRGGELFHGVWLSVKAHRKMEELKRPALTYMCFSCRGLTTAPGEALMCDSCCLFLLIKWQPGSFTDLPTEGAQMCAEARGESEAR